MFIGPRTYVQYHILFYVTVLLLALLPPEDVVVVFHEFTYQQEGINSGDAVGNKAGNHFTLATSRLRSGEATPKRANLARLLLDVFLELGFS